uniref:Transmembrane protein n=1 Tax=Solanum lycopersicum TaxID=4081 RepID=A0A3Q7G6W4_SOLLC
MVWLHWWWWRLVHRFRMVWLHWLVVVICKRELGVVVTCTLELVVVETYKLVWDDMVLVEDGMASWVVVVTCTLGYVVGSVVLWVVVVTCKLGCVEGSVGPWVVVVICKQELEVVETCKRGDDGVEEETYKLGWWWRLVNRSWRWWGLVNGMVMVWWRRLVYRGVWRVVWLLRWWWRLDGDGVVEETYILDSGVVMDRHALVVEEMSIGNLLSFQKLS